MPRKPLKPYPDLSNLVFHLLLFLHFHRSCCWQLQLYARHRKPVCFACNTYWILDVGSKKCLTLEDWVPEGQGPHRSSMRLCNGCGILVIYHDWSINIFVKQPSNSGQKIEHNLQRALHRRFVLLLFSARAEALHMRQ